MQAEAIRNASIVGAGLMGADIAVVLALAGVAVTLVDVGEDQLNLARARMKASVATLSDNDLVTQEQANRGIPNRERDD